MNSPDAPQGFTEDDVAARSRLQSVVDPGIREAEHIANAVIGATLEAYRSGNSWYREPRTLVYPTSSKLVRHLRTRLEERFGQEVVSVEKSPTKPDTTLIISVWFPRAP